MVIAVLIKKVNEDEGIHDSFDDLEKALRRISDTDMAEGDEDMVSYQEADLNTSPTPIDTYQFTALQKKDEQASLEQHFLSGDAGGDRGNKLKEKPQTSPTSPGELGLIGEER